MSCLSYTGDIYRKKTVTMRQGRHTRYISSALAAFESNFIKQLTFSSQKKKMGTSVPCAWPYIWGGQKKVLKI